MPHFRIKTENRELPLNQPENWQVKFPRYMVKIPEHVHDVNISYIGIQPRHEENPARGLHTELNAHVTSAAQRMAASKVEGWIRQGAGELSPILWEKIYVEAGYDVPDTEIYILYWTDKDLAKAANKRLNLQQLHKTLSRSDQEVVGLWRESFTVPKLRFETVYSGDDYQPGIASLEGAHQVGHKFTGFWGAARDRIPASSHDPFEPEYKLGTPNFEKNSKNCVIEGENKVSVIHIRSGQFWERCKEDERAAYESTLEPILRAGMTYLEENAAESGDIGLRFSRNIITNRLLQEEEAKQLASSNGIGKTVVNGLASLVKNYAGYLNGTTGTNGVHKENGTNGTNGTNATNGTNGAHSSYNTNGIDGVHETNRSNGTNGINGTEEAHSSNSTNANGVHGASKADRFGLVVTKERRRRETCSSGFFRSLRDIEAWASKHKSHHKIFHGAHSHSQQFGKETFKMRTWHEVSALKPGEVTFEYINCYPRTGLIPFFDM
ncbi:heme-dehydratase domain-containing protein [Trichoderma barbatum]